MSPLVWFVLSGKAKTRRSTYSLQDVDEYLDRFTTATREDQQVQVFKDFLVKATPDDVNYLIRLVCDCLEHAR